MPEYRRNWISGGSRLFTVTLQDRGSNLLVDEIVRLRRIVHRVRRWYPFRIDAWVVLPDHMHAVWTLPEGDAKFALRWRQIKAGFSRGLDCPGNDHRSRDASEETDTWQPRNREYVIRNEEDFRRCLDYVHMNPVRHGLVDRAIDWPYSTFHRYVAGGTYPEEWGGRVDARVMRGGRP